MNAASGQWHAELTVQASQRRVLHAHLCGELWDQEQMLRRGPEALRGQTGGLGPGDLD